MTIADTDYFEIITEIGYPIVKEDELEFTKTEIENYFIYPALRDYFTWFPKKLIKSEYVSNSFEIAFPNDNVYSVLDARINTSITGDGKTSSPFINEMNFKIGRSSGIYGTDYDYGTSQSKYMERAYGQAQEAYIRAQRLDINESDRILSGFTNVSGELIITWAMFSENFNDVPFRRKSEVIDLAKSKVLKGFAMIRSQLDSDTGVSFNYQDMSSRSDDLEEKVLDKWKILTKSIVIRN